MRVIRLTITYALVIGLGIGVAFGLSFVAGLLSPFLRLPVFVIVSVWWIWIGWKYASLSDRALTRKANLPDD